MEVRRDDESVAPTSFLWAAYWPHRYKDRKSVV